MDMASLGEYLGAMNKLQIHPPNLTYLAVVMWWKGSGRGQLFMHPIHRVLAGSKSSLALLISSPHMKQ